MATWEFWGVVVSVLKAIWPNRAKPKLLKSENCSFCSDTQVVCFDLLVDNSAGLKDCSVISVDLIWLKTSLECNPSLPRTIPFGSTVRITMSDVLHKMSNPSANRLELQPNQKTIEDIVIIEFNTGHKIKQEIIFNIKQSPIGGQFSVG